MKKLGQNINVPRGKEEGEHYNPTLNHAAPLVKRPTTILVFFPTNFEPIKLNEKDLEKYFFCKKIKSA